MKARTLFFLMVLAAIAAFAALNWGAFMAATTLSLGVAVFQAPLGLIMLGLVAVLTALFLGYVLYLQTSVLLEARRHAQELRSNRELADHAEASRFNELRSYLEAELLSVASRDADTRAALLARIEQSEGDLRSTIEQTGNTLAAYIGELEDRLEQGTAGPLSGRPA
jgi:hypothetical protein